MRAIRGVIDENIVLRKENAALRRKLREAGMAAGDMMKDLANTREHLEATAQDRARVIARCNDLELAVQISMRGGTDGQ